MGLTERGVQPTMDYTRFLDLPDSDNIRVKHLVKKKVLANTDLLYLLNAVEADLEPADYFGKYVLPYGMTDLDLADSHNYICFDTSVTEIPPDNSIYKHFQIIFNICIHKNDVIHPQSGIPRHDLISALLTRDINWSKAFGMECSLTQDEAGTSGTGYVTRTLVFEATLPNGIAKSDMKSGESFICNTDPDEDW